MRSNGSQHDLDLSNVDHDLTVQDATTLQDLYKKLTSPGSPEATAQTDGYEKQPVEPWLGLADFCIEFGRKLLLTIAKPVSKAFGITDDDIEKTAENLRKEVRGIIPQQPLTIYPTQPQHVGVGTTSGKVIEEAKETKKSDISGSNYSDARKMWEKAGSPREGTLYEVMKAAQEEVIKSGSGPYRHFADGMALVKKYDIATEEWRRSGSPDSGNLFNNMHRAKEAMDAWQRPSEDEMSKYRNAANSAIADKEIDEWQRTYRDPDYNTGEYDLRKYQPSNKLEEVVSDRFLGAAARNFFAGKDQKAEEHFGKFAEKYPRGVQACRDFVSKHPGLVKSCINIYQKCTRPIVNAFLSLSGGQGVAPSQEEIDKQADRLYNLVDKVVAGEKRDVRVSKDHNEIKAASETKPALERATSMNVVVAESDNVRSSILVAQQQKSGTEK